MLLRCLLLCLLGAGSSASLAASVTQAMAEALLKQEQRYSEARDINQLLTLYSPSFMAFGEPGEVVNFQGIRAMATWAFMNCKAVLLRPTLESFTPASDDVHAHIRIKVLSKCLVEIADIRRVRIQEASWEYFLEPYQNGARYLRAHLLEYNEKVVGAF